MDEYSYKAARPRHTGWLVGSAYQHGALTVSTFAHGHCGLWVAPLQGAVGEIGREADAWSVAGWGLRRYYARHDALFPG